MPVINGVKMACAPCIRGHRSTKCAHHDRVMIAVKKPGRPLSTCPHAPGIQCGCGGVQAAIPIQHHGRCPPPVEKAPCHDVPIKAEEEAVDKVIQSPTRTTQRVKKSSRDSQSRKQSIDPTALERMNPNSLNVMPSPSVSSFKPIEQASNASITFPNHSSDVDPLANSQPISHETSAASTKESTDSPRTTGSCCGSHAKSPQNGGQSSTTNGSVHGHTLSTGSSTPETSSQQVPAKVGGCCSSKAKTSTQVPETVQIPIQQIPIGAFVPQFPQFGNVASAMYAQNVVNGMGFWPAQMPQQVNGYMFPDGIMPQYQPTYQVYPPTTTAGMYPVMMGVAGTQNGHAHGMMDRPIQCHCGDICECLGCIDHPFNSATRDYVASAINVQGWTKNGDDETEGSTEDVQSSEASSSMPSPAGAGDPLLEQMMSPQSLQQQVSSDYLVFNYSYGCLGEPEHCPCGDDCACVGCTIHAGRSNGNSQGLDLSS